jgi:hypothetical protein
VEAMFAWAAEQPWAKRLDVTVYAPPAGGQRLNPTDAWDWIERMGWEHRVHLVWAPEPDGSYSWALYSKDRQVLMHGTADSWSEVQEAVIDVLPPSGEK